MYFAYGSNLDEADLARWCAERGRPVPKLRAGRRAYLPDRRLAFTQHSATRGGGVLDVVPARGASVGGVAFDLDADALATLDAKETEGHAYDRVEVVLLTEDARELRAFAYEAAPASRRPHVPPPPAYLDAVRRGYAAHGLDVAPLDAVASGATHRGPVGHVFVYGTLMRGECREHVMTRHGGAFAGDAEVAGGLVDLDDHPGLLLDLAGSVRGELHAFERLDGFFHEADVIEGFRGFGAAGSDYRRAIVLARRPDGTSVPAWLYVLCAGDGLPRIASGSWRHRA